MPAFAPVDKLELGFVLGVGGAVEVTAVCLVVAEGPGVALLVEGVEVLVENNVRSFCSNSTTIGWPHMVTGPEIAVVAKSESLARARTVVRPFDLG